MYWKWFLWTNPPIGLRFELPDDGSSPHWPIRFMDCAPNTSSNGLATSSDGLATLKRVLSTPLVFVQTSAIIVYCEVSQAHRTLMALWLAKFVRPSPPSSSHHGCYFVFPLPPSSTSSTSPSSFSSPSTATSVPCRLLFASFHWRSSHLEIFWLRPYYNLFRLITLFSHNGFYQVFGFGHRCFLTNYFICCNFRCWFSCKSGYVCATLSLNNSGH